MSFFATSNYPEIRTKRDPPVFWIRTQNPGRELLTCAEQAIKARSPLSASMPQFLGSFIAVQVLCRVNIQYSSLSVRV